jgi:hypothetical protein
VAIKLIRILEDDLDGTDASETLTFSLDGLHYEIDLNTEHAQELRTILAHYIVAGRKDIPGGGEPALQSADPRQASGLGANSKQGDRLGCAGYSIRSLNCRHVGSIFGMPGDPPRRAFSSRSS